MSLINKGNSPSFVYFHRFRIQFTLFLLQLMPEQMYRVIFLFFSFYIPVISQCEHFWIFLPFLELGVAYTEHIRIPEHKQVDSLMFILLLIGEVLKFDRLMGPEIPDSKEVVQFPSLLLLASHDQHIFIGQHLDYIVTVVAIDQLTQFLAFVVQVDDCVIGIQLMSQYMSIVVCWVYVKLLDKRSVALHIDIKDFFPVFDPVCLRGRPSFRLVWVHIWMCLNNIRILKKIPYIKCMLDNLWVAHK